ncbi:Ribosomal protein S6 kinase beta-2 [Tieghemiomyces parasiticus]|uniref:Ribosomal protein S6 kinase beta-2 n=1 Tax=Tieghemiomyces parasiticus TaxID=78921 RepID=A0A9W7ZUP3_9FUNG|nr:Ribosomal protein S6 kinase beta-2 [Tieghemiomyces parasiticus]
MNHHVFQLEEDLPVVNHQCGHGDLHPRARSATPPYVAVSNEVAQVTAALRQLKARDSDRYRAASPLGDRHCQHLAIGGGSDTEGGSATIPGRTRPTAATAPYPAQQLLPTPVATGPASPPGQPPLPVGPSRRPSLTTTSGLPGTSVEEAEVLTAIVESAAAQSTKVGLDDFHIHKFIGQGAYGKVFLVQHKVTGRYFAMKSIRKACMVSTTKDGKKNDIGSRTAQFTRAERAILEDVRHPFIVQLFYAFQTERRLYLILEYVPGGELFHHMSDQCMFTERAARFFCAEIVCALEHLHAVGIIYRDLKPENCLLDREGHIVLTDFGLSKLGVPVDGKTSTFCGTTEYMAPEILDAQPYDRAVDWWSLGILLFDMITGAPPFTGSNRETVMSAIRRKEVKFPAFVSPEARSLIKDLLRKDPLQRLGTQSEARRPIPPPSSSSAAAAADEASPVKPGGSRGGSRAGRGNKRGRGRRGNASSSSASVRPINGSYIRAHRFFRDVDWVAVEARHVRPPIIPRLRSEDDTSNFDKEFTSQPISESPACQLPTSESVDLLFRGFSYTANHHHPC